MSLSFIGHLAVAEDNENSVNMSSHSPIARPAIRAKYKQTVVAQSEVRFTYHHLTLGCNVAIPIDTIVITPRVAPLQDYSMALLQNTGCTCG